VKAWRCKILREHTYHGKPENGLILISGGDFNLVSSIVTSMPTVLSPSGQMICTFQSLSQMNGAAESAAASSTT
jgi:hypothetical protein